MAHPSNRDDIQADLIDRNSFAITRNIGNGNGTNVDSNLSLVAKTGWRFDPTAA